MKGNARFTERETGQESLIHMVQLTIDDIAVDVPDGTLVLEAAMAQGIDVPTFCYQKRLSPLASCRMCLVAIEGSPKLQPACVTAVMDGMVVHTATEQVAKIRKSMLELLLANHPLDCPICDKSGECELQDMVFEYGAGVSRFNDEKRVFSGRDLPLNQVIIFNSNRCIQCQRCVRMCEEVVGAVALGTVEKGMDTAITGFENSLESCDHCGNCIEVCPVGALMSQPYRYKARPWDLVETDTTCPFCGTGCQLTVSARDGQLARVTSKYETGVNGETLCVKGRYGIDFIDGGDRIVSPLLRRNGTLSAVTWEEAYAALRQHIGDPAAVNGSRIGGLASPTQSCETLYVFQKMMRLVFATNNIDSSNRWASGIYAALPSLFGDLYTRRPLGELLEADCILVIGSTVTDDNPVSDYLLRGALRQGGSKLFLASARPSRLDRDAGAHLRLLPGDEAHLIALLDNALAGTAVEADAPLGEFVQRIVDTIDTAATVTLLIGVELLRAPRAKAALEWLERLLRRLQGAGKQVALQFLFDRCNQMGAWEMGVLPTRLPGWRSLGEAAFERAWGKPPPSEPGADVHTMLERCAAGEMDMLYLLGSDPVAAYADRDLVEKALSSVGLLVVQAAYRSATTAQADIILPGAAFGEETGTVIGNEGRVQMSREIRRPLGDARRNMDILRQVGEAFDCDLGVATRQEAFTEFARLVPSFRGLSLDDIGEAGALTAAAPRGGDGEPDGLPMPARSDGSRRDDGKLMLVTGDCGFHSGYVSELSKTLSDIVGESYVEIGLAEGQALGLAQGDAVIVRSGRGETRVRLRLNKQFPPGVAFIPENFAKQNLNRLFSRGEYPCPVDILPDHAA